jgi:diguanylate cyclase
MHHGKALKEPAPAKSISLERVLNQSEGIKERVDEAATSLASVHLALKQEGTVAPPAQTVDDAVVQIEAVEEQVVKASEDLHEVNGELAREVAERTVLESELAETKGDLADARDDLARSRANEEESRQTSLQDPVTGLSNRALFDQRLAHGLIQAKRHGWGLAIVFIDIDKFKSINDVHGHDLGDKVLLMVANRLQASVRGEDTVSRWGGDEFACILLGVKQEADVARIAENLVTRITEDCEFDGAVLSIGASLGVAVYPQDGETPDILFKNADRAMYRAKETGKAVMLFHQMASDCP